MSESPPPAPNEDEVPPKSNEGEAPPKPDEGEAPPNSDKRKAPPKPFQRKLVFRYKNIKKGGSLTLAFGKPIGGEADMASKLHSVAWRVISFGKGDGQGSATYVSNFAVATVNILGGNEVQMAILKPIVPGTSIKLEKDTDGGPVPYFREPQSDETLGDAMVAENRSEKIMSMAFGLLGADGEDFAPTAAWKDIGHKQSIRGEFSPKLYGWFDKGYQKNEMIEADIEQDLDDDSVFGKEGLDVLKLKKDETVFIITEDAKGSYKVTPKEKDF